MDFDILLQNNASRKITIISKVNDVSPSSLYLKFENIELNLEDGEYTYACIHNRRNDVVYETSAVLMDTVVKTNDGNVLLRDLCPLTGILRYGKVEQQQVYNESNNNIYYYQG